MRRPLLVVSLIAAPLAAHAQTAPSATPEPAAAAANTQVQGEIDARSAAVVAGNAAGDAQYAADMDAWLAARQVAAADRAHYRRQQRAYADAMAAWRIQVSDCDRGVKRACNAPTPDPAAFY